MEHSVERFVALSNLLLRRRNVVYKIMVTTKTTTNDDDGNDDIRFARTQAHEAVGANTAVQLSAAMTKDVAIVLAACGPCQVNSHLV